ncbi:MAG TPA: ABC transporter substrate-binding protein [Longimicrobiales bacterium]|nr:ABC transporter substrate-binding protein [Longimicrobiales bacterium]
MNRTTVVAAVLLLSACRENAPVRDEKSQAVDTGGTAVIAIPANPDFLNGLLAGERWTQDINRSALFLPLLQYDEKLQLKPLLAKSWEMEGDTAVVLHLRDDVRWQDSVKTSAYDVEFTYRYGTNPKTEFPNGDYWVGWNGAQVIDSFTVRFSISPQPDALANLPWIPIMPKHLLEKSKPEEVKTSAFNLKPIGNGPFRVAEYKPNDRVVLEANRDYPEGLGGRPNLARVIFRIVPDETAQQSDLTTGAVDLIPIRPDRIDAIRANQNMRVISREGRQFGFVAWNTQRAPLNNPRVRRALTMAVDREKIIKVIRRGEGSVAVGPVPPFHWSYDPAVQPLPYAPDSAKRELAELGLSNLTLELKAPSNTKQNADIAELIRSDLAAIGVTLNIRLLDFNTMIGDLTSDKRNFQGALMAWENDFRLVLHDNFHSKAMGNPFQFSSYRNPAVDSILDFVESTPSRDAAIPKWRRLQTIMRDEQPWMFLFNYSDAYAARDRLQDVKMDIRGVLVNLPEWWVKK